MRIALFGGSFDPVHCEHLTLVRAAIESLKLDKVIVMPSYVAPHKRNGAHASAEERLEMCRLAFSSLPDVEVSDYEIRAGGTSFTYRTCRFFAQIYPDAERFLLVGADMLDDFYHWYRPEEILNDVTLAACGREEALPSDAHERFCTAFGKDFAEIPYVGKRISSTQIRVALAFPETEVTDVPRDVLSYIRGKGLYRFPRQEEALLLEKAERREHSLRVAKMACMRAKAADVPEDKALLAAMLHDCGKYVSPDSPLLTGWEAPEDVPAPVIHQYVGAYLAEKYFDVKDEEILNAIRYHTSGRPGMSALEKLIFLSDMLEEGRHYRGVDDLRALFWRDLDLCLRHALEEQLIFLRSTGKPVYPLTEEAYRWIKSLF